MSRLHSAARTAALVAVLWLTSKLLRLAAWIGPRPQFTPRRVPRGRQGVSRQVEG